MCRSGHLGGDQRSRVVDESLSSSGVDQGVRLRGARQEGCESGDTIDPLGYLGGTRTIPDDETGKGHSDRSKLLKKWCNA